MSIRVKVAAASIAVALSVTPAFAELLDFSWTGSSGDFATWSQPSNPTPVRFRDNYDTEVQVSDGTSAEGPFQIVEFDSEAEVDGGFFIDEVNIFGTGLQVYTGSEAAPIFAPGHFIVSTGSLTITAATTVPESSTWAMMLIGFAGLGYAALRRKAIVRPPLHVTALTSRSRAPSPRRIAG